MAKTVTVIFICMFVIGALANLLVLVVLLANNDQLKLPSGMYGTGVTTGEGLILIRFGFICERGC